LKSKLRRRRKTKEFGALVPVLVVAVVCGSAGGGSSKRTYQEYVHQAIVALADRTGSSLPAITKWIL
jgi:hypothetical protein